LNGREFSGRYETRDARGRIIGRGTQRFIPEQYGLRGPWIDEQGPQASWILLRPR